MLKQCVLAIWNNEVKSNFLHLSSPLLDLYLLQKLKLCLHSVLKSAEHTTVTWLFGKQKPSGFSHYLYQTSWSWTTRFLLEFQVKNWLTLSFSILHLLIITSFSLYSSAAKSSCQAKHAQSKWPCVLVHHIISREFHFQNTRLHNPLALEIGPGLWIYWSRVPRNKNMSVQLD